MTTLNVTRLNLLLRDLLRNMTLIIKRRFHRISRKDSFRIIMTLIVHYDLELHQIDVKTVFLNGDLEENVYMYQLMEFTVEGKEHVVCKLKKSIYSLKTSFPPMVFEV